jgi:hypothetical protein
MGVIPEKLSSPVEVADKNVKLGDLELSSDSPPTGAQTDTVKSPTPDAVEFTPDPGKDYILNELSFEIKKMTAELKYLNEELENLKALSKMWVKPPCYLFQRDYHENGSTVFGKVIYQDEESLKVETLVGYLIINRQDVVRMVDNVVYRRTGRICSPNKCVTATHRHLCQTGRAPVYIR